MHPEKGDVSSSRFVGLRLKRRDILHLKYSKRRILIRTQRYSFKEEIKLMKGQTSEELWKANIHRTHNKQSYCSNTVQGFKDYVYLDYFLDSLFHLDHFKTCRHPTYLEILINDC